MKLMQLAFGLILSQFHVKIVNCANILIVWPWHIHSHFQSFQILFEELVNREHNVTLIGGYPLQDNLRSNYTFIDVSSQFPKSSNGMV